MKKLLILLTMVIGINFNSKSANIGGIVDSASVYITQVKDSVVQTVKEVDTSSTFRTMYSDFKQGIVALASSLKVGAEHVYGVLVKQQIVKAITWLFLSIIGFLLLISWIKVYKKDDEDWGNNQGPSGIGIIRGIQIVVALLILGLSLFRIDTITTGLINPEYGAIEDVIEMVKDIK
jgi:hypothetical protein